MITSRHLSALLLLSLWLVAPVSSALAQAPAPTAPTAPATARTAPADTEHTRLFRLRSELLTAFWGREMFVEAAVFLPPGYAPKKRLPVMYRIHGFGGSHLRTWRSERRLLADAEDGAPPMIHVFLNAQFPLGHHEFADSVNNGPWGAALTTEFIPALEAEFGAYGAPEGRFLTGHSSGGWSSLWLQVVYPDFFNGTWSTAPDPVDFRDFTGVDIYAFESAYVDPAGEEVMLMRRNGEFFRSIREFAEREIERGEFGGQFASFDAVFSPRGEDGRPMPLFDRATGVIDPDVAEAWKRYDIGLVLKERWDTLAPALAGKLHVFCGDEDTFRLEGAVKLLQADLRELGSDAEFVLVPERHHGNLGRAHDDYWPEGMMRRIQREMVERFESTCDRDGRSN